MYSTTMREKDISSCDNFETLSEVQDERQTCEIPSMLACRHEYANYLVPR